jgi:ADP-heptose:LPS heptosyltransferase
MLTAPRLSLGLLGARWHFRKSRDEVISFSDAVSSARHALIVMPLDGSPLYPVAPVITMLRKLLTEEQITVVVAHHSTEALEALKHSPVIRILPAEISTWFLPRHDVITRITTRKYDIALDLNLDFVIPSGYICRESKARVRIGFAGKGADLFLNMQIHTGPTESKTQRYERMAKCLQMF